MVLSVGSFAISVGGSAHPYEDRVLVDDRLRLYAVADGVSRSTQGSGGRAAEVSLELLKERPSNDLARDIQTVHERLLERRLSDAEIGETTITAALFEGYSARIANVGDSPAFIVSKAGCSSLAERDRSPSGYITQVLGFPERILVHEKEVRLEGGEYVVLASDGIEHVLEDGFVSSLAKENPSAKELADSLMKAAREHKTPYDDDKSVIVIKVLAV